MPIIIRSLTDAEAAELIEDYRHGRISRRDAVESIQSLMDWRKGYIESMLDDQRFPPDQR